MIPRLITLMHATTESYLHGISLLPFSLLITGVIFICSFKRKWLIDLLGIYLTPILLLSLTALVFFGLTTASSFTPDPLSLKESFLLGLLEGYNTMDLIAAFLFATVILPLFEEDSHRHKKFFLSSLIAASLLFITYLGLCLVSAHHGWTETRQSPR